MERRRVVVTGMGVVSPVGIGVDAFWNALLSGKSGVTPITEFDPTDFPVKIAGEVKDFDPSNMWGTRRPSVTWIEMLSLLLLPQKWQPKMRSSI